MSYIIFCWEHGHRMRVEQPGSKGRRALWVCRHGAIVLLRCCRAIMAQVLGWCEERLAVQGQEGEWEEGFHTQRSKEGKGFQTKRSKMPTGTTLP